MADEFAISVQKWVEAAKAQADQVFQAIAQDALAMVKEKTPVRTGNLKAGWQASVNGIAAPQEGAEPDSAAAIASATIGDSIVIFNPVVYAARVEFGFHGRDSLGRLYKEKGAHMMEETIVAIPDIAKAALARFKK